MVGACSVSWAPWTSPFDAGVGLFAVSTYNTDYILVKKENLLRAVDALRAAGYEIS